MVFLIKIDFSNFLKCAGDVARSEPSDQIAINDSDEKVTWQREKRSITREISALDFHLKRGYVAQRDYSANRYIHDLIRAVDMRSYNGSD